MRTEHPWLWEIFTKHSDGRWVLQAPGGMLADMFPPARPRTVLVIAAAADQAPDMDQVRTVATRLTFPTNQSMFIGAKTTACNHVTF